MKCDFPQVLKEEDLKTLSKYKSTLETTEYIANYFLILKDSCLYFYFRLFDFYKVVSVLLVLWPTFQRCICRFSDVALFSFLFPIEFL